MTGVVGVTGPRLSMVSIDDLVSDFRLIIGVVIVGSTSDDPISPSATPPCEVG